MADEAAIEGARREWAEAEGVLGRERDADQRRALFDQVEVVTSELRRRVGQTFTLGELVDAYMDAERWTSTVLAEADAPAWWPRTLALVQAAAFARYMLGAVDYTP